MYVYRFEKPLSRANWDYHQIGKEATNLALKDANIKYNAIQAVVCSYCYGEPTCGQRALYEVGMTGIPIFNTNNNCSSGSSAIFLAKSLVESGQFDCVLALGFEKMERGLSLKYTDREIPSQQHFDRMYNLGAERKFVKDHMNVFTSEVIKMFALAGQEYNNLYPKSKESDTFAKIAYKNHCHGVNNPNAAIGRYYKLQDIKKKPILYGPLTTVMASPTSDGGAACIICSEEYVKKNRLYSQAIEIAAQHIESDARTTFNGNFSDICGIYLAEQASRKVLSKAGLSIKDIDVVELHDCFSAAECLLYEALGLCEKGQATEFVDSMKWVENKDGGKVAIMGGKYCINPSGGLESKGHPIGATGIAQCNELVTQLRRKAGKRQVPGIPKYGLQHNYGIVPVVQ